MPDQNEVTLVWGQSQYVPHLDRRWVLTCTCCGAEELRAWSGSWDWDCCGEPVRVERCENA